MNGIRDAFYPDMLTAHEENWTRMVASFAKVHLNQGATIEQAIIRGIADYTKYLQSLANSPERRARLAKMLAQEIHAQVNGGAR